MTRNFRWAIAIVALAAMATIPMAAQPPQGRGFGGGGRMGPGGPGPGPMPLLRGLDLSASQREQIRAITEAQHNKTDGPPPKMPDLQRQLQLALFGDTPDQGKIDELKAAIAAAHAEELATRIDVESRIAQVLTPEQRAQARDALSKPGPPSRPRPAVARR
jgi:protein CpxP